MKHTSYYRLAGVLVCATVLALLLPWVLQHWFHLYLSTTLTLNLVLVACIGLGLPFLRPKLAVYYWNSRYHPKIDKNTPNPERVEHLPASILPKWQIQLQRFLTSVAIAALIGGFASFRMSYLLSSLLWSVENPLIMVFLLAFGFYLLLGLPLIGLLKWSARHYGKTNMLYQQQENWASSFLDAFALCVVACLLVRIVLDGVAMM